MKRQMDTGSALGSGSPHWVHKATLAPPRGPSTTERQNRTEASVDFFQILRKYFAKTSLTLRNQYDFIHNEISQ